MIISVPEDHENSNLVILDFDRNDPVDVMYEFIAKLMDVMTGHPEHSPMGYYLFTTPALRLQVDTQAIGLAAILAAHPGALLKTLDATDLEGLRAFIPSGSVEEFDARIGRMQEAVVEMQTETVRLFREGNLQHLEDMQINDVENASPAEPG